MDLVYPTCSESELCTMICQGILVVLDTCPAVENVVKVNVLNYAFAQRYSYVLGIQLHRLAFYCKMNLTSKQHNAITASLDSCFAFNNLRVFAPSLLVLLEMMNLVMLLRLLIA